MLAVLDFGPLYRRLAVNVRIMPTRALAAVLASATAASSADLSIPGALSWSLNGRCSKSSSATGRGTATPFAPHRVPPSNVRSSPHASQLPGVTYTHD